ncbi:cytochrome c oxidase accessory protein CcoG [Henriciella aquimarina]|uniref:cytochrome c oxidase accessory protein CcoG n=1 Tax=Henriciella aquimarina TaxID=545261 RepID=UPI000A000430|nr:cytochrome c oxidase accessory protein CcoG [Henriciella aquimarina]
MNRVSLISSKSPPPVPPPQDLYSKRKQIYPKLAHGKFRTVKWAAMAILLGIYYLVPWLRWERGAGVPDQAVLADFGGERFFFFGIEIWPQEAYYLAGLMILAALGLFLVTSLFGRVWCGYACPQTVWTDLYIWVERAFEGDRAKRMRLDHQPWSFNKAWRKVGKHIVWLIIAFLTGGAFILYFHDARMIAQTFFIGEAPLSAYWFAGILTFTTYALAGTMREQVCTYLCPWPRIQAALTDEHALNVTYRYDRGEPRGPLRKGEGWDGRGDCIDCKQCVQVCPMGIDIRDGSQLECIHCALCIDACDEMMKKVGRPTGLIAYDTDVAVAQRAVGETPKYRLVRARTVLYAFLIVSIASLMAFGLFSRGTFEVNVLKDRSPPYVRLSNGDIRNGYTLKLVNKSGEAREMLLLASGIQGLEIEVVGLEDTADDRLILPVASHGVDRYRMLVTVPEGKADGRQYFRLTLTDTATGEVHTNRTSFMAGD